MRNIAWIVVTKYCWNLFNLFWPLNSSAIGIQLTLKNSSLPNLLASWWEYHNDGCVAGVANSFFLPHARCCFLATQKLLKIPLVPKLLLLLPYLFCSRLIIPCPCGGPIPYLPPPPSPPTKIKDYIDDCCWCCCFLTTRYQSPKFENWF